MESRTPMTLQLCSPSLSRSLRQRRRAVSSLPKRGRRGAQDLVVMLDGTLSTLHPDKITNVGQIYQLLSELPARDRPMLYYEEGMQWDRWKDVLQVMNGVGINRQIQRAYGWLASRYRPGDRIFLIGYSRGAFAVRSLAGVIDRLGLLKARAATERNIRDLYRHYRSGPECESAQRFARRFCYTDTPIEMVGVFDTVKALGIRLPLLWRLTEPHHSFHSPELSHNVNHGFHALALNETRLAFAPILWREPDGWQGRVEQMWFRGTHGDIGGQLAGYDPARPLSNIPLCWMIENLSDLGVCLPSGWRASFPCDPEAPSSGNWSGWGKLFLFRRRRSIGQSGTEHLHPTAVATAPGWVGLADAAGV